MGHGYSARAVERLLPADKWCVVGTTRAGNQAESETIPWPGTDLRPFLAQASHILISIAPGAQGDPVLNALRDDIAKAAPHLRWVGYLSTTAVYGDHQGGWVDENTPLSPASERGRWRVEAEQAWQDFAYESSLPLHIFRLAGIYGPGRGPFAKLRAGTARRIIKPGQVFSRIHVEDLARVLAASMAKPRHDAIRGAIYNVCDDDPAPPQDVIAHAAHLMGLPVPEGEPFETASMSPMVRSFYGESKRVSNARMKAELGITLRYPDYESGLKSLRN